MDTSFYTATRAAMSQQERMNVISNNIANLNTTGYRSKNSVFMDLLYYNMKMPKGVDTNLKAGTGVMQQRTNTDFTPSGLSPTGQPYDYAINGEGFFMLRDPITNEISYTRDGHFSMSQRGNGMFLISDNGKLVLDANRNPIRVTNGEAGSVPGVYTFANFNGMESVGYNEFASVPKNGAPILVENPDLRNGYLEMSNASLADEMANTIQSSRAYAYALKMVQTSDEVENTINRLRD